MADGCLSDAFSHFFIDCFFFDCAFGVKMFFFMFVFFVLGQT